MILASPSSSSGGYAIGTRSPRSRLCSHPGCSKQVQQGGVCCRHGARTTRALCTDPSGCTNVAKRGGLCRRHGAFQLGTCGKVGCKRVARSGGHCDLHQSLTSDRTEEVRSSSSSSSGGDDNDDGIAAQVALSSSPTCVMQHAHYDDMGEYDTTTSPMMRGLMYRAVSGETYEEMLGGCIAHAQGGNGGDNPPIDEEELDLDFLVDYYEDMY